MSRLTVLCAIVLMGLLACSTPTVPSASSDERIGAEIQQAIKEFNESSGRGDLAAVLAKFDEQADILLVGSDKGEVYKGRAAMAAWLGSLYKSNGFGWQIDRMDISHHGETAWAFVEGKMNVADKTTGKLRFSAPYRFSVVYVRKSNGWALRLFHGSAPGKE